MSKPWLPACYFPTTVVLVDDSAKYLQNVSMALDNEAAYYKTFNIPMHAADYLESKYRFDPFTNRCLLRPEEEALEHRTIDIDIRKIHREIYNPSRFAQISVVIVDYAMPGMNGLELCQQIKDIGPIGKILLTGEADARIAIDAFNSRIIDRFIRKDAQDFNNLVNDAIRELQYAYFQEISKIVTNTLTEDLARSPSCLNDPSFMRYFKQICIDNNIAEYYLMDGSGSFLLLDVNARPSWLAVKTEDELHDLFKFASAEGAPSEVIEPLNARIKIPYFHSEEELQTPPHEWGKYLHSARLVQGDDLFYCALITDPSAYSIDLTGVRSFVDFREHNLTK